MDTKTIVQYASFAVAGVALLTLVTANPVVIGIIFASAAAYFVAERLL